MKLNAISPFKMSDGKYPELCCVYNKKTNLDDKIIKHPISAAIHIIQNIRDDDKIDRYFDKIADSEEYRNWRSQMPQETPNLLTNYQSSSTSVDLDDVSKLIEDYGITVPEKQWLFHGGLWDKEKEEIVTDRPLSTSFSPAIALRNAIWDGKAYDNEKIDLFAIFVAKSDKKAFIFDIEEGEKGCEKEVLFSKGVQLIFRFKVLISEDYLVGKGYPTLTKRIPVFLCFLYLK